jgi:hypothetical protein
MKPPTEKQLNRIAAHGQLIDRDYTRREASEIISQLVESGEEPDWSLAHQHETQELVAEIESRQIEAYISRMQEQLKQQGLDEMKKDRILCEIDDSKERLKDIARYRREGASDRINQLHESLGRDEHGFHTEWSEQIKKPTRKQVRTCVEALDEGHPGWEDSLGLRPLVSTLLLNYPDLERKSTRAGEKKADAKGCLVMLLLCLVPALVFVWAKV